MILDTELERFGGAPDDAITRCQRRVSFLGAKSFGPVQDYLDSEVGIIITAGNGRVAAFLQKPELDAAPRGLKPTLCSALTLLTAIH